MGLFDPASDAHDVERTAREVKDAIISLRDSLDEGTRRNAQDALSRYEDLNQKLIVERKRCAVPVARGPP